MTGIRASLDPLMFQILWARAVNIADEMATVLVNTAFSHVVRDNHDIACGVYDAEGNMLAQATQCTPGQVGAMPSFLKALLREYSAREMTPGDVFITNDPWLGSGHTPDIFLATPAFLEDTLIGFAVTSAHHIDIGGRMAAPEAREVYEEGIILPITRLYRGGEPNQDVFRLLRRNVRMPDKVIGDLRAQIAANDLGVQRMLALITKAGLKNLTELACAIIGHTESSMRKAIAAVPDGVYSHRLALGGLAHSGRLLEIHVRLEVADDEILVDLTGTSPQVDLPINSVYNITQAYVLFPIKCALHPGIPNNSGSFGPIRITVPEGTILNATFPAPCMWRTTVVYYIVEAVFGALAQAVPDRVMAPSGTYPLWLSMYSGRFRDGRPFLLHFNAQGGQGALDRRDGLATTVFPPNVASTSVEQMENEVPMLCERKAFLPDSGGPGRRRGGLAQEVVLRNLSGGPVVASLVGGRYEAGPPGVHGGFPGGRGGMSLNDESFNRDCQRTLDDGDALRLTYPGGGGFGDPLVRPVEDVLRDVRLGLVSVDHAASDYGVMVASDGRSLDLAGTARMRRTNGR